MQYVEGARHVRSHVHKLLTARFPVQGFAAQLIRIHTFWANSRPEIGCVKAEKTTETAVAEEEGYDEHEETSEPILGQKAVVSKLKKQQEQQ